MHTLRTGVRVRLNFPLPFYFIIYQSGLCINHIVLECVIFALATYFPFTFVVDDPFSKNSIETSFKTLCVQEIDRGGEFARKLIGSQGWMRT